VRLCSAVVFGPPKRVTADRDKRLSAEFGSGGRERSITLTVDRI
jgi:hypothetical protein